jgi:hypothetical protein
MFDFAAAALFLVLGFFEVLMSENVGFLFFCDVFLICLLSLPFFELGEAESEELPKVGHDLALPHFDFFVFP